MESFFWHFFFKYPSFFSLNYFPFQKLMQAFSVYRKIFPECKKWSGGIGLWIINITSFIFSLWLLIYKAIFMPTIPVCLIFYDNILIFIKNIFFSPKNGVEINSEKTSGVYKFCKHLTYWNYNKFMIAHIFYD